MAFSDLVKGGFFTHDNDSFFDHILQVTWPRYQKLLPPKNNE